MIVHFAAFIFKQEFKAEEPQKEAREKITEALSKINVPGRLGVLKTSTPLYPEKAKGHDFALIVRFEDEDALKRYAVDPEHKKAQEVIKRYANLEDTLDYDLTINGEW
ncbi:unnamed protein product [Rhizoctonia solani]|uniref:Stress-response A/B barrel domain-containing protein n=1 Tax=Rhizoctonia solani TaxID=456999 RepID=A0A8H3AQ22_9AGAM|nr:unnamed protein product [Rhizoctonia solani]CAE6489636.1 unnamed protein product [Rhizoctonia solani]